MKVANAVNTAKAELVPSLRKVISWCLKPPIKIQRPTTPFTTIMTELNELLCTAGNLVKDQIPDANVAFFLLAPSIAEGPQSDNFELHIFESDQPIDLEDRRIENFFTAELVGDIAKSNRICTIEDMLAMGLAGSPACLEKISTAAIPLSTPSSSMGFVLIYRSSRNQLTADELKAVAQIMPGLGRSIASCRALVNSI